MYHYNTHTMCSFRAIYMGLEVFGFFKLIFCLFAVDLYKVLKMVLLFEFKTFSFIYLNQLLNIVPNLKTSVKIVITQVMLHVKVLKTLYGPLIEKGTLSTQLKVDCRTMSPSLLSTIPRGTRLGPELYLI